MQALAIASQVGITMVTCILGGLAVGMWLDSVLNTKPFATLAFILLGVAAGTYGMYQIVMKLIRETTVPSSHRKEEGQESRAEKDGEE